MYHDQRLELAPPTRFSSIGSDGSNFDWSVKWCKTRPTPSDHTYHTHSHMPDNKIETKDEEEKTNAEKIIWMKMFAGMMRKKNKINKIICFLFFGKFPFRFCV